MVVAKSAVARAAEDTPATASQRSSGSELLLSDGIFVRDAFLGSERVRELIECARTRKARGEFAGARIGGGERLRRDEIRGDDTCWLEEPLFAAERLLLADMEQLRLDLNREAFLGLFALEMHYAWYPPGAGYARHVDQLQGREDRMVSVVLYLNESWVPADGGELRLFDGPTSRDVEPLAGRLVGFVTAGREHAVLPTQQDRLSLTGWFRRRPSEAVMLSP
jgi:SM-20-related protein